MKKLIGKTKDVFDVIAFCFRLIYSSSKKYFFLHILLDVLEVVLPFASIYMTSKLIDVLSENFFTAEDAVPAVMKTLIVLIVGLQIFMFVSKAVNSLKNYIETTYNELLDAFTKRQIMDKAAALDIKNFDMPEFFDTLNDVNMNSAMIIMTAFQVFTFFRCIVQFIIAFANVVVWNFYLPLLITIAVIPSVIINNKQMSAMYNFQQNNMKYDRKMYYLTALSVSRECAQDIRMFRLGPYIKRKFDDIWVDLFNKKRKLSFKYTVQLVFIDLLPLVIMAVFLIKLGYSVIKGNSTVGDYNMYESLLAQVISAIYMLVSSTSMLYDGKIRVTNYKKFLELESDVVQSGELEFDEKDFIIEFRNVCFRYNGQDENVLNNVSFTVSSREKTALVGTNGSGKTTIIKLLFRLYDPTSGEILINGHNISEFDINSIRRCFSPMFQNYFNYAFTVRDNIVISDLENENDEDKILKAAKDSGVWDFAKDFDEQLDTYLTRQFEDGEELSGGQWQKVALSRTFFRDAPMYILDEPSSALDAESEDKLFRQFEKLYNEKGAILVSHRLSNVKNCDKIIVIDNGEKIEEGTHSDLIGINGKYAHMFNLQAEKYM
ncbi:ABC transporter ATP-binding protein [Ruminococcus flavefaciens]|uniref:ABC transporter ATP-binding protein n=1 Tax=Ruminococcus flavefaciens TaxID=1265 RepID=UPI0026EA3A29|nr:ABC transporter ATP-binding protein [Ruminococcus flavefaciens]